MTIDPLQEQIPAAEPLVTRDALRRPMHDLRISLLDRCNFRCPYCMPASEYHADYEFLTRPERLTHDEILSVARAAAGLGVSKLRITGGEPLLDRKLPDLVAGLAVLPGVEDLAVGDGRRRRRRALHGLRRLDAGAGQGHGHEAGHRRGPSQEPQPEPEWGGGSHPRASSSSSRVLRSLTTTSGWR